VLFGFLGVGLWGVGFEKLNGWGFGVGVIGVGLWGGVGGWVGGWLGGGVWGGGGGGFFCVLVGFGGGGGGCWGGGGGGVEGKKQNFFSDFLVGGGGGVGLGFFTNLFAGFRRRKEWKGGIQKCLCEYNLFQTKEREGGRLNILWGKKED